MKELSGKVVLVTGASTGIGAAVAQGFGERGAKVAIHYNSSAEEADAVKAEITKNGGVAETFQADVCVTSETQQLVNDVVDKFGGLDILVCNAGGLVARHGLAELDEDFFHDVMNLNVKSVMECCAAAIPHLLKTKGNVIVTGSLAARMGGGKGASLYAGAKAAVQNMVRAYASEFGGQGVRFNAVSPGTIKTLFHEKHTAPEVLASIESSIPMQKLGTPQDCVGAYLFLGSNALSGYVTGQIIEVNGGQFMA